MARLLRTELRGMAKSNYMRVAVLLCAALGLYGGIRYEPDSLWSLLWLEILFLGVQTVGLLLYLMDEKNGGTLRSKIVAGYKKSQVFLSQTAAVLLCAAVLWTLTLGIFLTAGAWEQLAPYTDGTRLFMLANSYLMHFSSAVLALVCSDLIRGKGYGEIAALTLMLGASALALWCSGQLDIPEYLPSGPRPAQEITREEYELAPSRYTRIRLESETDPPDVFYVVRDDEAILKFSVFSDPDEDIVQYYMQVVRELVKNPFYVEPPRRSRYEALRAAVPVTQVQVFDTYVNDLFHSSGKPRAPKADIRFFPLWSLLILLGFAGTGLLIFRKLDLK